MTKATHHWPEHVQQVFAAIGAAMGAGRLYPETLCLLTADKNAILEDHTVEVRHISGKELGTRKGLYTITIEGPRFAGGWRFVSGELERLARAAVQNS